MVGRGVRALAGLFLLGVTAFAVLALWYGPRTAFSWVDAVAARAWGAIPGSWRSLLVVAGSTARQWPGDVILFVPIGALLLLVVYLNFVAIGARQINLDDKDAAPLRPIRRTSLSGPRAVYEPYEAHPEAGSTTPTETTPVPAPQKETPFGPAKADAPWSPPEAPFARTSADDPKFGLGTSVAHPEGRWVGSRTESTTTDDPSRPSSHSWMTVWTAFGKTVVPNDLPPPWPGSSPPPSSRFGTVMLVTFVAVTTFLAAIRDTWLSYYDQLVARIASLLYYHAPSAPAFSFPIGAHPLADYILLMYLSLMVSWGLASGVFYSRRYTGHQKALAFEILAFYIATEMIIDAVAFGVNNAFVASGFLVVRGATGGFFSMLLLFDSFVLPKPVTVAPQFPRRRGSVAAFVTLGIASLLIAGGILYLFWGALSSHGITIPFAVLLLEPLLTVVVFDLLGGILYQHELNSRPAPSVEVYHPSVSIIIPAYNEARGIAATIRSADAAARLYPGVTEIVVGNDGSTDQTSEIAREEIRRLQYASGLVLDLPHGGKSNALNGALRVAQGDILIRVDADTRISPEYGFGAIVPHFADPEVGAIQGLILPLQRTGWVRKLRLLEICWNHLFLRRGLMATRATQVVDGAFCAFRRKDILDAGGWVYWNGEDNEITLRLYRIGFRTRYEPRAVAFEDVPENYRALRKQRVRWNRGGVYAHRRHFGALSSGAFEFGGIAVMVWALMFMRAGMRYFIYVYAFLVTLIAGVATIFTVAFILLLLLIVRGSFIAYYVARLGYWRDLVWIPFWPIGSAIKQAFAVDAFGSMVPGHGQAEFSE